MRLVKTLTVAAALACGASAVAAEVVEVRVERAGFYPPKVWLQIGDQIEFTNMMTNKLHLRSMNVSNDLDDWFFNSVQANDTVTKTVDADMELRLRAPCYKSEAPQWWPEPTDTEAEITAAIAQTADSKSYGDQQREYYPDEEDYRSAWRNQLEDDICDGWRYNRFKTNFEIVIGQPPLGY